MEGKQEREDSWIDQLASDIEAARWRRRELYGQEGALRQHQVLGDYIKAMEERYKYVTDRLMPLATDDLRAEFEASHDLCSKRRVIDGYESITTNNLWRAFYLGRLPMLKHLATVDSVAVDPDLESAVTEQCQNGELGRSEGPRRDTPGMATVRPDGHAQVVPDAAIGGDLGRTDRRDDAGMVGNMPGPPALTAEHILQGRGAGMAFAVRLPDGRVYCTLVTDREPHDAIKWIDEAAENLKACAGGDPPRYVQYAVMPRCTPVGTTAG